MSAELRQGIVHATLLVPALDATCTAYEAQLGLSIRDRGVLSAADAGLLDLPDLAGHAQAWLANGDGDAILRLIEDPAAVVGEPMFRHGWLALEVLVGDIDSLAADLHAPFRVLGPAADLELSDAIRAAQVLGPCGELLYLTQVKAAVPPFDLPMTTARVAVPFIGVMSTPHRAPSRRAWAALLGAEGWAFDTRITVLNRAHERDLAARYPVAVVPMPGKCLVEIDEVELAVAADTRAAGLHSLALRLPPVDDAALRAAGWRLVAGCSDGGTSRRGLVGPAGEHVELL